MVPVALHDLLLHPRFMNAIVGAGDVTAAVAVAAHHNTQVASVLGLRECMVAHWELLVRCLLPMHQAGMLAWLVQHVQATQPPRPLLVQSMLRSDIAPQEYMVVRQWQSLATKVRQHRLRLALRVTWAVQVARVAARAAAADAQAATFAAQLAVQKSLLQQHCQTAVAAACAAARAAADDAMAAAAGAAQAAEQAVARHTAMTMSQAAARAAARAAAAAEQAVARARKRRVHCHWRCMKLKLLAVQVLQHWAACQQQKCRQEDRDREMIWDMFRAHQHERKQALLIWRWQRWGFHLREKQELERWTSAPYTHPLLLVRALVEQRRSSAPPQTYTCVYTTLGLRNDGPKFEWTEPETAAAAVLQLPPCIPTWLLDLRICQPSGNETLRFACTFGWQHLQRFLSQYVRTHYLDHLALHAEGSPVPTYRVAGLWPPMELRIGYCNVHHAGTVVARDGLYSRIHFDNGNKDNVHQFRIKNVNLEVGDRVQAPYQNWTPMGSCTYHRALEDSIAPEVLQKYSQTPSIAQQLQAVRQPLSAKAIKKKGSSKKKRR